MLGKLFQLSLMNLRQGYIIGNPVTDHSFDSKSKVPFSYGMGIISDELYKAIEENCEGEDYSHPEPRNLPCFKALTEFNQLCLEINDKYILDPKCPTSPTPIIMIANKRSLREDEYGDLAVPPHAPDIKCVDDYAYYLSYHWTNNKITREALHIKKGTVPEWVRCNYDIPYTTNVPSSLKYHHNLIQRGYRALVYSGDHDLQIPFLGTRAWVEYLNFTIVDNWRSWHVDDQVAGYTTKFMKDFTYATVKNAGHTAPTYQPKNCLAMFDRWISHGHL